jgi:DNA-binding CsgD family transcriptional regulator
MFSERAEQMNTTTSQGMPMNPARTIGPSSTPVSKSTPKVAARVGVLLLNANFRPVHYNAEAANVLSYPKKTREMPSLEAVFPLRSRTGHSAKPTVPSTVEFTSGRRRYKCRAFLLDSNADDSRQQPRIVLLIERELKQSMETNDWSERFRLTHRECETVKHLLRGLTSKEIAVEMSISPNTVKTFVKLAMAKVGASNRTGLIARIFEKAS